MNEQNEAHIGFEPGAPAAVRWSEKSFIRPVEPHERRSLRLQELLIVLAILVGMLLTVIAMAILVVWRVLGRPTADLERTVIPAVLGCTLLSFLVSGHVLKLIYMWMVRSRQNRLFEPKWSCIFADMKGPKKGKKNKRRKRDFGLIRLLPGCLEIEMENHRARLSTEDITVMTGKGWDVYGDRVKINLGTEPLYWEVTLQPLFQGMNIGVFGAAIINYRWLWKRITEGIGCGEKYVLTFRTAAITIVAFLGLLHSALPLIGWAMLIALVGFGRAWPLLGLTAHGIPAFLLFGGFLAAYISARKQRRCALYLLVWSVLTMVIFFAYDVTNQNYQDGCHGAKTYFYFNWPLYRGSIDTWHNGYINKAGEYVIRDLPCRGGFSEGLSLAEVEGKRGYIDISGKYVIRPRFRYAKRFSEGFAAVSGGDKYGYIDKTGNFLVEAKFDWAEDFSEGLASVSIDGKWGYINQNGDLQIEAQFDLTREFSEELAAVKVDSKWGFIDRHGQIVIEPRYDRARDFHEGLAVVEIDNKWGYVAKDGELVIQPVFEWAGSFSEGLAPVMVGHKCGYVDQSGEVVISARFDDGNAFSEGLASVRLDGEYAYDFKYGYIDSSGGFVIKPQFRTASPFRDGLALVSVIKKFGFEQRWGYINTSGEFVIKPVFYSASRFSEGMAFVETIEGLGRGVTYGLVVGLGVIIFAAYRFTVKGK